MTNSTAQPRHNYPQPNREGKKALVAYADAPLAERVKFIAMTLGKTVQDYLIGLVEKDMEQNQTKNLRASIQEITSCVQTPSRSGTARRSTAHTHGPTRS